MQGRRVVSPTVRLADNLHVVIEHWHEVYRVMQFWLQVIGIGTVVRAIPKGIQWLLKLRKQRLENRVLQTFYEMDDGPWQSAHGVVGELCLKAAE
jgi:hypothetical protein